MKNKFIIISVFLAMALMASPVLATQTFIFTGTDASGDSVSAKATITIGSGTVTVDLWNLTTPMEDAGQLLSDLSFMLSDTPTGAVSLISSGGTEITMTSTAGTFTSAAGVAPGWGLSSSGSVITLDDLNGGAGPQHTIIGPADNSEYSSANSSIVGVDAGGVYKDTHSPFMFGSVEWVLAVPGVNAGDYVKSVTFSFGTQSGDNHTVPLPATAVLMGSGLLGLGLIRWRRR